MTPYRTAGRTAGPAAARPVPPGPDRPHKQARLAAILDAHRADAILLSTPENLAWYFDGARASVPYGGGAVFSAIVHRDGTAVVTALANEADRLAAEEVHGAEFRVVDWFGDLTAAAPGVLRDTAHIAEVRAARAMLLPEERARYGVLGRDLAAALTRTLAQATPTMTEYDLAGDLARAVLQAGAEPSVILVAGAARAGIPHPLPTRQPLGRRAMAVVTARRHGLHASLTRWVSFTGAPTAAESALREVEADAFAATRPGRPLGDVLADIAGAYPRHGLGSAVQPAWRAHHQGGPTGYLGRDPKVDPTSADGVVAGGAFAWNPWVPGAKIEDTVIVDAAGIDVLTVDPAWPAVRVRGLLRPLTLDLS